MNPMRNVFLPALFIVATVFGPTVASADDDHGRDNKLPCPVTPYDGVTSMDDEFGYGTQAITQCLRVRHKAKVVIAVDSTHPHDAFGVVQTSRATYLTNIEKMVRNYEVVHGMTIGKDVDIVVVLSQSGSVLGTKKHAIFARSNAGNPTNPFISLVEFGLQKGIKFYICQEASRALGIKIDNVIDGVHFVPGGHIATADFQLRGYALIRP